MLPLHHCGLCNMVQMYINLFQYTMQLEETLKSSFTFEPIKIVMYEQLSTPPRLVINHRGFA